MERTSWVRNLLNQDGEGGNERARIWENLERFSSFFFFFFFFLYLFGCVDLSCDTRDLPEVTGDLSLWCLDPLVTVSRLSSCGARV